MDEKRTCTNCGREFIPEEPMQLLCPDCARKLGSNPGRGKGDRYKQKGVRSEIPAYCFFDSFYDDNGKLKKEIFLDAAKTVAEIFERNRITASSLRKFFSIVKAIDQRLSANPKLKIEDVRDSFYKIIPLVNYQYKRGVIKRVLVDFLEGNFETAIKSREEFKGFAHYFTSIICYAKQK